ncbi:DUF262 domain-containing protein [Polynucleobacter paneuropaeus]|nr:DUF262 domain-containing protein [Polynucleobacter paneuropaeus]
MPFGLPITIKEAVNHIHKNEYLLPAIQREFVWSAEQIEKLFDSLMRGYPISSFLFWKVEKSSQKNYQFYEFIREFHERDNTNNPKASIGGEDSITAILDGQQRLTSLYIGLMGSYAYKLAKKRWDNSAAFPKRVLCLNLISRPEDPEYEFDFRFLTEEEVGVSDENHLWFIVGECLAFKSLADVNKYLISNIFGKYPEDRAVLANDILCRLFEVIHQINSINYFLEEGESLDKVLDIFVRINSGGTPLSYSDLLLSIASAEWKERDAREEINSFVKELNSIGDGFNLNKDFVLKSCLVLADKDMAFKVENFNQDTMLLIEKIWPEITKAISAAVTLLASFGYQRDTLTSSNAIIPIAYYLKKIGSPTNFDIAKNYEEDRKKILKWLRIALLKRVFSGQPDNVLRPMRDVIRDSGDGFPFDSILAKFKGSPKALTFDDDEVINLTAYEYGEAYTYSALSFLYPSLDFRNRFHLDHIYPKWMFSRRELANRGISKEKIPLYLDAFNSMANLQLLEGIPNQEKSGKDFQGWLMETYPNPSDRKAYMERNFIPEMSLTLDDFLIFIEVRKKLLLDQFQKLLK